MLGAVRGRPMTKRRSESSPALLVPFLYGPFLYGPFTGPSAMGPSAMGPSSLGRRAAEPKQLAALNAAMDGKARLAPCGGIP